MNRAAGFAYLLAAAIAGTALALSLPSAPSLAQGAGGLYWQCKTGSTPGWCPVSSDNPLPTAASSSGASFSTSQITLGITATQVLAAGDWHGRKVCNVDTSLVEYVGPSSVTTSSGLPLAAGACLDLSGTSAAIYAVAASGTPKIAVVQY